MFSYSQLRRSPTAEEWAEDIRTALSSSGYVTDTWVDGSLPMLSIQMASVIAADISARIASLADQTLFGSATGDFLTIKAFSDKGITRIPGTAAVGVMRFKAAQNEGPFSVNVGDLTVAADGQTFTNVTAFTIPLGDGVSYQTGSMQCNEVGIAGNIASDSAITLQTQNVDVTVTNPDRDDTTALLNPGWLQTLGVDEQGDESLRELCFLKDAATARGENTVDRIKYDIVVANSGSVLASGIFVDDQAPRGPGTFDVYVAQPLATATQLQLTRSLGAISASFMSGSYGRIGMLAAPTQDMNVSMFVLHDPTFEQAEVEDNVEAAVDAYIAEMPLGGRLYNAAFSPARFFINDFIHQVEDAPGVRSVTVTSFCGLTGSNNGVPLTPRTKLVLGASGTSGIVYLKVNA